MAVLVEMLHDKILQNLLVFWQVLYWLKVTSVDKGFQFLNVLGINNCFQTFLKVVKQFLEYCYIFAVRSGVGAR